MQIPAHPEIHAYPSWEHQGRGNLPQEIPAASARPGIVVTLSQPMPAVNESEKSRQTGNGPARQTGYDSAPEVPAQDSEETPQAGRPSAAPGNANSDTQEQQADLQKIRQLQSRDREVKAHEAAHAAVGGHLTGSSSFTFERGPDGVHYAVAGEVSVASPAVSGDPEKTLQQAEQVQRAAMAPANPSSQDLSVAADAARTAADARLELAREIRSQAQGPEAEGENAIETDRENGEENNGRSDGESKGDNASTV